MWGREPREDNPSEPSAGQRARRGLVAPAYIWAFSAAGHGAAAPLSSGAPEHVMLQGGQRIRMGLFLPLKPCELGIP